MQVLSHLNDKYIEYWLVSQHLNTSRRSDDTEPDAG